MPSSWVCTSPWAVNTTVGFWTFSLCPSLLSSNLFCSACTSMLLNQPRILVPLEILKQALASPWFQKECHHVHWFSWIDYEFSLFWSLRSDRCRHPLNFTRSFKFSFSQMLELVNMFRQVPCRFAGASFLVRGGLMWSSLEFWRARTILMRRTLLDNSSLWTISFPNFYFGATCLWRIWRRDFQNTLPLSAIMGHTTQLCRLLQ